MSNTNNNLQTQTSNALHNSIMEAGEPKIVAKDDALSKEKEIDKLMALISLSFKKIYKPTNNNLRTSSNTTRAHQDNTLRINRGTWYDNQRIVNVDGGRENVAHYMYMAQIQEITPDAAHNSRPIFGTEPSQKVQNDDDNYNVFANDREHPNQSEYVNDTYLDEQGDTNVTIDLLDMSTNREMVDQDDDDLAREHTVMSDSEDSIITYTAVSSPYGGLSDIGSPGVDGPPVMPEDPYAYVYPPSPEFVPKPIYPEFMPAEDDILLAEEQPLPAATSPTIESPGYIDESDPEDDPKEDPEDDPEEDPVDYPTDGEEEGDDEDESSDDEDDESSDDDKDEDIDIEGDEEKDEYLAPTDSIAVALPAIDHAASAEETEPFETDESTATPPPHHTYRAPLGYRVARLQWKAKREENPEADLPLWKRLCTSHTRTYELVESSAAAAARHREPVRDDLYREISMIYSMLEERQDDQALQRARVNRLFRDRRFYAHTTRLMEGETRASRTDWIQSMDASNVARSGVIALRTQVAA
nr:hypothetical protein [Tanacetum cinerariifolium]